MFNYIKADFYRIFAKKGLYRNFLIMCGLIIGGFTLWKNDIDVQWLPEIVGSVLSLCQLIISVYLLITVYGDEFNAKTFPTAVGSGKSRIGIVLAKLLANLVLTTIALLALGGVMYSMLAVLGFSLEVEHMKIIASLAMQQTLLGIGFSSVAIVIGFWSQKASAALSLFIMLSLGFFGGIVQLIKWKFELRHIDDYLLEKIVFNLFKSVSVETVLPYIIYVVIFTAISMLIFRQKDLDF